jgi:hypothetical protein
MFTTEPKLEDRAEQPYVAIRTQAPVSDLGNGMIPRLQDEVLDWLGQKGIAPAGPPLMRFHVIDMPSRLDIELGWPVASPIGGEGHIVAGALPAGRYATLVYTGVANGVPANKLLIDWAREQGIEWDHWDTPEGDAFRSRYESLLTEPTDEPDPAKWETEVAIKLADA